MHTVINERLIQKIKDATGLNPDYIKESHRIFNLYFKKNSTSCSYTKEDIGKLIGNTEAKRVLITRRDILSDTFQSQPGKMGAGKLSAQAGHAIEAVELLEMRGVSYEKFIPPKGDYRLFMNIIESTARKAYLEDSFVKIVLTVKNEVQLLKLYTELKMSGIKSVLICDEGRTVFENPTNTFVGVEPMYSYIIDCFTRKCQLLK